ncbi:MAG: hypothetical protein K940chlam7_01075, partial [Chlamydiae bacterium]|nr:hypothetical protein [Chlamydiota bacterium]
VDLHVGHDFDWNQLVAYSLQYFKRTSKDHPQTGNVTLYCKRLRTKILHL